MGLGCCPASQLLTASKLTFVKSSTGSSFCHLFYGLLEVKVIVEWSQREIDQSTSFDFWCLSLFLSLTTNVDNDCAFLLLFQLTVQFCTVLFWQVLKMEQYGNSIEVLYFLPQSKQKHMRKLNEMASKWATIIPRVFLMKEYSHNIVFCILICL